MIETPEEMYTKIAKWLKTEPRKFGALDVRDMWWLINHYRSQVQVLREALGKKDWNATSLQEAFEATEDKWGEYE